VDERLKRIGILLLGWFFVVLGIVGLFLPILQGILFLMIGLAILSSRSQTVRRFLKYLEDRYPQYYERVETWRERVGHWRKKK
jgi:uncharacterized membrane protein YbaN (DUF454 family)